MRRMRYKLGLTPPVCELAAVASLPRHHSTLLLNVLPETWSNGKEKNPVRNRRWSFQGYSEPFFDFILRLL